MINNITILRLFISKEKDTPEHARTQLPGSNPDIPSVKGHLSDMDLFHSKGQIFQEDYYKL